MPHQIGLPTKAMIKFLSFLPHFDKRRARKVCTKWKHNISKKMEAMRKLMFPISEEHIPTRNERLSTYQNFYVNYNEDTSTSTSVASHPPPYPSSNSRYQRSSFCRECHPHSSTAPRRLSEVSRSIAKSRGRSSVGHSNDSNYPRTTSSSYSSFFEDGQSRSHRSHYPSTSSDYQKESTLRRLLSENHVYHKSSSRKNEAMLMSRGISASKPQAPSYDSSESPHDVLVAGKEEDTLTESYQELPQPEQKSNLDYSSDRTYLQRANRSARKSYMSASRPEISEGVVRNHLGELVPTDSRNFKTGFVSGHSPYREVKFVIQEVVSPNMLSHFHQQSSPRVSNPHIAGYIDYQQPGHSRRSNSNFSHYSGGHQSQYSGGAYSHNPHYSGRTDHRREAGSHRETHHHQHGRDSSYHPSRRDPSTKGHHQSDIPRPIPRSHHHNHTHHDPSGKTKRGFVTHRLHFRPESPGVKQSQIERVLKDRRTDASEKEKHRSRSHRDEHSRSDNKSKKLVLRKKKTSSKRH